MNASKLFTTVAALAFAGAAFAADIPAGNTAANAATAQAAAAAQAVAAQADAADKAARILVDKRAQVIDASSNRRATEASQFDWIMQ